MFKLYCDPIIKRMMARANQAQAAQGVQGAEDELARLAVAGKRRSNANNRASNADWELSRLRSTLDNFHPKCPAIRLAFARESSSQVLSRDSPSHVCDRRELHQIHADS